MVPDPGPVQRALTSWIDRGAPRWVERRVRAAIARAPTWSRWYDQLRELEQLAAKRPVGVRQLEALEHAVLASVQEPATARANPWLRPLGALAAAAACALVFVRLEGVDRPAAPATYTHRSASDTGAAPVGARVRCLSRDGARVLDDAEAGPRAPADRLACPADALLTFSLTNLDERPRHVFAVGIGEDGRLLWYEPFGPTGAAIEVAAGEVDRSLEVAADLSRLPRQERATVHLLFSDHAIDGAWLKRNLAGAARAGVLSPALERLPVDVQDQARVELYAPGDR